MITGIKVINWGKNLKNLVNIKLELIIFHTDGRDLRISRRKKKIRKIIIET